MDCQPLADIGANVRHVFSEGGMPYPESVEEFNKLLGPFGIRMNYSYGTDGISGCLEPKNTDVLNASKVVRFFIEYSDIFRRQGNSGSPGLIINFRSGQNFKAQFYVLEAPYVEVNSTTETEPRVYIHELTHYGARYPKSFKGKVIAYDNTTSQLQLFDTVVGALGLDVAVESGTTQQQDFQLGIKTNNQGIRDTHNNIVDREGNVLFLTDYASRITEFQFGDKSEFVSEAATFALLNKETFFDFFGNGLEVKINTIKRETILNILNQESDLPYLHNIVLERLRAQYLMEYNSLTNDAIENFKLIPSEFFTSDEGAKIIQKLLSSQDFDIDLANDLLIDVYQFLMISVLHIDPELVYANIPFNISYDEDDQIVVTGLVSINVQLDSPQRFIVGLNQVFRVYEVLPIADDQSMVLSQYYLVTIVNGSYLIQKALPRDLPGIGQNLYEGSTYNLGPDDLKVLKGLLILPASVNNVQLVFNPSP